MRSVCYPQLYGECGVVGRRAGCEGEHTVIEPVPEAVEAILDQILGSSEVEPRIDCALINMQTLQTRASNTHTRG